MNRIFNRVGCNVVSQLLVMGVQVRALARNPHTAGLPLFVDVVRGDLTLAENLVECLDGIDSVFVVGALRLTPFRRPLRGSRNTLGASCSRLHTHAPIGCFGRNDRVSYNQRFGGPGEVANRVLLEAARPAGVCRRPLWRSVPTSAEVRARL